VKQAKPSEALELHPNGHFADRCGPEDDDKSQRKGPA